MIKTPWQLCEELRGRTVQLETDSRLVREGGVFVALPPANPGDEDQTLRHAAMAIENKAWCIVLPVSHAGAYGQTQLEAPDRCFVFAEDVRAFLGQLAAAVYGTERIGIPVVAITGTNGKTTCAYLLEHLFASRGLPAGVLGTISYRWPGHCEPAPLTTPGCLQLHRSLAAMKAAGAKAVIMEASSHAIDQKRIAGIPFCAAGFTNLTQDHLDYHKTLEAYFQAKLALFDAYPCAEKSIAANADDEYGRRILSAHPSAIAYGLDCALQDEGRPMLSADILSAGTRGLDLLFHWRSLSGAQEEWRLRSPLVGLHNASNLLLVSALALSLGFSSGDLQAFSGFMGVPGRLERIPVDGWAPNGEAAQQTGVFVDYAHTPDALIRVLSALRAAKFKRVITVFGCGGDRDRTKRPVMGKAVADLSDIAIVTSDNPRTEDPERIIDDIIPGVSGASQLYREADRRRALELAASLLRPGDALLVAGKGHEDYQIIGHEKHHFSDQEILRELLA